MNYQNLNDPGTEPPGGFKYKDPDTGYVSEAHTLKALVNVAGKHRFSNGLDVPVDFSKIVETQLCQNLPPGLCVYEDGRIGGSVCIHRGEEIDKIRCDSCGGSVMGKVLACSVHGRCTMFKKDIGVKSCWTCTDRKEQ